MALSTDCAKVARPAKDRLEAFQEAILHDDYLRTSAHSIGKLVMEFSKSVISNFDGEYLGKPSKEDMSYLLHVGEERNFPSIFGSINCMNSEWKFCPTAWARQYTRRCGELTIILEVVASQNLFMDMTCIF